MEKHDIHWRDRQMARRTLALYKAFGRAIRHVTFPELPRLFDALGRELRARGFEPGDGMMVEGSFWRLLSQLAPRPGRRPVHRRDQPRLPPPDDGILAKLREICDWIVRLERPEWRSEIARCPICTHGREVPRIKKIEWMRQHIDEHRDRVAGVLVGLAAGDENGGPTEMALRLAQSLLERAGYDPADVFNRYLESHRQGSYDTGPVAGRVFELAAGGIAAAAAARQADREFGGKTAGCNPAHRAAVLAMAPWLSTEGLVAAARQEAGLTHLHPIAADAAVAMAVECRDRILGGGWQIGSDLRHIAPTLHPEVALAARCFRPMQRPHPPTAARVPRGLSSGGYSPDALLAAFWFALHATDPVAALAEAKKFAGPANYGPVLVGAMLGARFGASAFDGTSLAHHPAAHATEIWLVAQALSARWIASAPVAADRETGN